MSEARRGPQQAEGGTPDGVVLRPEAVVLPDSAVVPPANVIQPPPNRFTHELTVDEPYRFGPSPSSASSTSAEPVEADGVLRAGTPVVLLVDEGAAQARVVDGSGLYVPVRRASLRPLPPS